MPALLTLRALPPEDQTCETGKRKQAVVCLNTHQTAALRSCSSARTCYLQLYICIQRRPQQRLVGAPHSLGCCTTATVSVQTFCGWRAACTLCNALVAERPTSSCLQPGSKLSGYGCRCLSAPARRHWVGGCQARQPWGSRCGSLGFRV